MKGTFPSPPHLRERRLLSEREEGSGCNKKPSFFPPVVCCPVPRSSVAKGKGSSSEREEGKEGLSSRCGVAGTKQHRAKAMGGRGPARSLPMQLPWVVLTEGEGGGTRPGAREKRECGGLFWHIGRLSVGRWWWGKRSHRRSVYWHCSDRRAIIPEEILDPDRTETNEEACFSLFPLVCWEGRKKRLFVLLVTLSDCLLS